MQLLSTTHGGKNARFSCRIKPAIKELVETATQLLGVSVTDFAEAALEEKAHRVIAESERVLVSKRAFEEFVAAISSAPEKPSEQLIAAVAAYHEHSPVTRRS